MTESTDPVGCRFLPQSSKSLDPTVRPPLQHSRLQLLLPLILQLQAELIATAFAIAGRLEDDDDAAEAFAV